MPRSNSLFSINSYSSLNNFTSPLPLAPPLTIDPHSTSQRSIMAAQRVAGDSVVVVVGPQFISPHPLDLIITKKHWTLNTGEFKVKDVNGNVVFTVEDGAGLWMRPRRIVRDATGKIILTLRRKRFTAHDRWEAFRGSEDDVASEDQLRQRLLFSVKSSSRFLQFTNYKLDVFLGSNVREEVCDFRVKQGFMELGCTIHLGDGQTNSNSILIAQMYKNQSVKDILLSKDVYVVSVTANIDLAFIAALIVLFHEIQSRMQNSS